MDEYLVHQFQQGNHQVFETIVERYKKQIYFFALKLVQDHHEAEDISQETFIRAYKHLSNFRSEGSLRSWLFTIAINYYRSIKRKPQLPTGGPIVEEAITKTEAQNEEVSSKESQKLIKGAIAKLPPKQKLVLNLRTFEQLSYQEISQIMEISIPAVKANLSYARQALRQHLQGVVL